MASTGMQGTSANDGYAHLQGLERALQILEEIADRPMRAKDVAASLGLSWTSAYRTLTYLRENGYLRRDDSTGLYYIGSRLYYLGSSHLANVPVVQSARAYLRVAAQKTQTTAQLVARYRRRSINLLVAEGRREPIPKSTPAFHFPLHCGSNGQVLLAFAPQDFLEDYLAEPLESLTAYTITDPGELRARLGTIRAEGYCATKGDVQLSSASVAAPVRDATGTVIASATLIAGFAEYDSLAPDLRDVVLDTARSISLGIGWRPAEG